MATNPTKKRKSSSIATWRELQNHMLSQPKSKSSNIPWLLLPPDQEAADANKRITSIKVFNAQEAQVYNIKHVAKKFCDLSCCIGSSHGYLIFVDVDKNSLFILNPFTRDRIELPPVDTLLGSITHANDNAVGKYVIEFVPQDPNPSLYVGSMFSRGVREHYIQKAILSSDPCHSKSYAAVLICGQDSKLAFCQRGSRKQISWIYLDDEIAPYHDIVCNGNQLYVLGNSCALEIWNLDADGFPGRMMTIAHHPWTDSFKQTMKISTDLYVSRLYLVASAGKVMILVRQIGEFVDEDARPLHEGELLTDKDPEPLVCPYRTLLFHLFRMDFERKTWVDMKSLDDQAVFVGGNHSELVSALDSTGCEENSIYFTDDYWDRMHEDYLFGGHDMGVYNLKDMSVKPFYECNALKIHPPPCWLLPNPKKRRIRSFI